MCRFTGTSAVSWEEFETHFNNDRLYGQWSDALSKATLLRHLSGDALSTYTSADANIKAGTCNDALDFLRAIFQRPNDPSHYEAELTSLRQSVAESAQAFEVRVRNLISKAYPLVPSDARDSLAKRLFLDRLNDRGIALEVKKFQPNSLHAARTQVQLFADLQKHPSSAPPPSAGATANPPPSTQNITRLLSDHRADISRLQRDHERHVSDICHQFKESLYTTPYAGPPPTQDVRGNPPLQQAPANGPQSNAQPSSKPNNGRCYICQSTQHWKDRCPYKYPAPVFPGNGGRPA
ncbi:Hypp9336 [Branchiostoma lanceolatum]|uniref:Hypp9336 protein n=1 Tax=Branchiostoma lanceolatum TaxID=7740 RepID=A0A8S4MLR8_BRALA|nr:Hypp9336 [Branchiostoma lanceolatum]